MQRLAILGGTFDPIHWGHLLMAEMALEQGGFDRILWVPTADPPHKALSPPIAFQHRVEMLRLSIAEHPRFSLSPIEGDRPGRSFALHTLRDLQQHHPNASWAWILGRDAFASLPRWYGYQELIQQCEWWVAPRSGGMLDPTSASPSELATVAAVGDGTPASVRGEGLRWHLISMPIVAISSSLIRQRLQLGLSIRYWVPDSVIQYMSAHRLYQKQGIKG